MSHNVHKLIGQKLSKSSVCYVLITCEKTETDGDLQVEMTYQGDPVLASYLLQGAQSSIDSKL
jgi:hypothetical protein